MAANIQLAEYPPNDGRPSSPVASNSDDKGLPDEYIEKTQPTVPAAVAKIEENRGPVGYVPASDEERALDKRINRKLDWIVMPIISFNYCLAGLDKNSLGNALTVDFIKDTGYNREVVSDAVSMTAVAVLFAPFLIAIGRKLGVSYYLGFMSIGWGLCTVASAYCKDEGVFYFVRILQSILETPVTQLAFYFITTVYPRQNYGIRMAFYTGFSVWGGGFGNLIAYGVFKVTHLHVKNWQLLFILYGSFSCFFGLLIMTVVPYKLSTAWILTKAEKAHAVERIKRDNAMFTTDKSESNNVGWSAVKFALKDWQKLLLIIGQICIVMPVVGFNVFTPLLVSGMGFAGIKANLMSVTPFFAAYLGLVLFQWSSDRRRERSLHTIASLVLSVVGLAVLVGSKNNILRYVFLHLCIGGAFAPGPLVAAWLADNSPEPSIRAVVFGLLGLTPVSQVIAGQVYKRKYAPSFKQPLTISMGFSIGAIVIFSSIRFLYMLENKKRKQLVADWTEEEVKEEQASQERRGDRKRTFIRRL